MVQADVMRGFSRALHDRSAVRERVRRSRVGRRILSAYSSSISKRQVHLEARHLERVLAADPHTALRVVCDASVPVQLYGETVQALMLARYLAVTGHSVELQFVRHSSDLSAFAADQLDLARTLLPQPVRVLSGSRIVVQGDVANAVPRYTLFGAVLERGGDPHVLIPYLLNVLAAARRSGLPPGFLLTADGVGLPGLHEQSPRRYIGWHVRRGTWSPERNPSAASILADFTELAERFPGRDIVILSDPSGVAMTLSILQAGGVLRAFESDGRRVLGQQTSGFVAVVPIVLGAEAYFQRLGGGVDTIAMYSTVPYLVINGSGGGNLALGVRGERLVPWARTDQRFVVSRRHASTVRISELEGGAASWPRLP